MNNERVAKELVKLAKSIISGRGSMIFKNKEDIEFMLDITNGNLQIGMGGEWWNGAVKEGKNVFHHPKERGDPGYKPVTVIMSKKGWDLSFDVMGGFYGTDGQTFIVKVI